MEEHKIRRFISFLFAISALVASFAVWNYSDSFSRSIQPSSFRSFTVTGEGKTISIPDVASFTFSVVTQGGKEISALQAKNTEAMNSAITFVKSKGVDAKDIKTTSYSLQPRYQYSTCDRVTGVCPPATIVGYEINQTVAVKVRDFSKIGDIMAGVVDNGANTVSSFQFSIDDSTAAENKARSEAIVKAKAKAEAIASAGGFSVGRILNISEANVVPSPMYSMYSMKTEAAGDVAAPRVEPGSEETTVNVTIQFEIK